MATLSALVTLVVVSVEADRAVMNALAIVKHSRALTFLACAEVLLAIEARTLRASLTSVVFHSEVVRALFNAQSIVDEMRELTNLAAVLIMALEAVLTARAADAAVSEGTFGAGGETLVVVQH